MTVSSNIRRSGPYLGNGSATAFAYEFRILDDTHLRVVHRDAEGTEVTLAPGEDYTVTGVGENGGGSVLLVAAPATGETVTIIRNMPLTQEIDLENQGEFYAETIEEGLDALTMGVQQLREELDRSVKVPVSGDVSEVDELMGNVRTIAGMADEVTAVAGAVGDVTTVAGSVADVAVVAANQAAVSTVAGSVTAVTTVAAATDEITLVAENISSVTLAASQMDEIAAAPAAAEAAASAAMAAQGIVDAALLGSVPVGLRARLDGPVPAGWLACNGQAVSRTGYPDLFAKLGTAYGAGNGTTTFNIPGDTAGFYEIPFTSPKQIPNAGTLKTIPHGLNATPSNFELFLNFTTAKYGYASHEQFAANLLGNVVNGAASGVQGWSITADATNIYVRIGDTGTVPLVSKANGALVNSDASDGCEFEIRAKARFPLPGTLCIKAADGVENPALLQAASIVSQVESHETALNIAAQYIHMQSQKPSGTNGGTSTQNTWTTREINHISKNSILGSSTSNNKIKVPPGSYELKAKFIAYACGTHRIRAITSNSQIIALGLSQVSQSTEYQGLPFGDATPASLHCFCEFSEETEFMIQHNCQYTRTSTGFGFASGYGTEIYGEIIMRKLA